MKKITGICLVLLLVLSLLPLSAQGASHFRSDPDVNLGSGHYPGDIDGSGQVDNKDVEYLLWYTLFPKEFPIIDNADYDKNGRVDNKDVEYLLWHTLFPGDYPLMDPIPE